MQAESRTFQAVSDAVTALASLPVWLMSASFPASPGQNSGCLLCAFGFLWLLSLHHSSLKDWELFEGRSQVMVIFVPSVFGVPRLALTGRPGIIDEMD